MTNSYGRNLLVLLFSVSMVGGVWAAVSEPLDIFAHPERSWLWKTAAGKAAEVSSESLDEAGLATVQGHGVDSATAYLRFPGHRMWAQAFEPVCLLPIPAGATGLQIDGEDVPDAVGLGWHLWESSDENVDHVLTLRMPPLLLSETVAWCVRGGLMLIFR